MPNINNVVSTLNKALPTMGGEGARECSHEDLYEHFSNFALAFTRNLRSGCEAISQMRSDPGYGGCVVNEVLCGDWASSDWYCANDKHIETFTRQFKYNDQDYSIQMWWTHPETSRGYAIPWFVLYKDGEFVTEITEDSRCRYMGFDQQRDHMIILDRGIKEAIGADIDICMDERAAFWCSDEI